MTDPERYGEHAAPVVYDTVTDSEVEPKVKAATAGAGAAGIVTGFVVWGIDGLFYNGDAPPDVPFPVVSMVGLVVGAGLAFAAGFYAKHVNR